MPRKKKEPEAIFREFICWNCGEWHSFKRSAHHMSKLKPAFQGFKNLLYGWIVSTESGVCSKGGAYLEAFDPEEELVRTKGRGARK